MSKDNELPKWKILQNGIGKIWDDNIKLGKETPDIERIYFADNQTDFINELRLLVANPGYVNVAIDDLPEHVKKAREALSELEVNATEEVVKLPEDEFLLFDDYTVQVLANFREEYGAIIEPSELQQLEELEKIRSELNSEGLVQKASNARHYQTLVEGIADLYKKQGFDITKDPGYRTDVSPNLKEMSMIYRNNVVPNAEILAKVAGVKWDVGVSKKPPTPQRVKISKNLMDYEQSIMRDLQGFQRKYENIMKVNTKYSRSQIDNQTAEEQKEEVLGINRELLGKYMAYDGPGKVVIREEANRVLKECVENNLFTQNQVPKIESWRHPKDRTPATEPTNAKIDVTQMYNELRNPKLGKNGGEFFSYLRDAAKKLANFKENPIRKQQLAGIQEMINKAGDNNPESKRELYCALVHIKAEIKKENNVLPSALEKVCDKLIKDLPDAAKTSSPDIESLGKAALDKTAAFNSEDKKDAPKQSARKL